MKVKYLVAGPGRTGSVLIATLLSKATGFRIVTDITPHKDEIASPVIYHSHIATIQLSEDVITVCPIRTNLFDSILSSVIAEHTAEWFHYSGVTELIKVDFDLVEKKYIWCKRWQEAFSYYTHYKNKIYLDFNQFTEDPAVVFKAVGLLPPENITLTTKKSPYGKHNILNFEELEYFFKKLECDTIINSCPITEFDWGNHRAIE